MPPPTAQPLATRILLGPALRTQSDHRLVRLVREGYEAAFEEIVRRYRRPLDRFAAAIVGPRAEDVTQDAFSKALLALRGSEAEIELRPWLYRIVRNTALNDLRDGPPASDELDDGQPGGGPSAAVEAERREEMAELMRRLRALPETQRAAIVMRELEGLSHEEIAAALGVSGGAARQAIHRARTALRDGFGLLLPLPLLRALIDGGGELAGGAAAAGGASAGATTLGGLGGGAALKVGVATVLVAGTVGAGIAVQGHRAEGPEPASAASQPGQASSAASGGAVLADEGGGSGEGGPGEDRGGHGSGDGHGGNRGPGGDGGGSGSGEGGSGGGSGSSGSGGGSGSGSSGGKGSSGGSGTSGEDGGHNSPSHSDGGSGEDSSGGSGSGSGSGSSGGSDSSGSDGGSGSSGGSDDVVSTPEPTPTLEPSGGDGESSSGSISGSSGDSGSSGSGSGSSGSGSDDGA
jgi:RNA polymerase sigma factor (sigma-70 family)